MDNLSSFQHQIFSQYFSSEDVVIIAPLNWGLGHASRCIPIIHYLKSTCRQVIIASDGTSLSLLENEFPDLVSVELPSYRVRYAFKSMLLNMICMMPNVLLAVIRENKTAGILTRQYSGTIILSDNRLGFRNKSVKSIYLTHQINILNGNRWISGLASKIHQWYIKKFDVCLVPDYSGSKSLCPELSGDNQIAKIYIGPLTRIKKTDITKRWDICVLLSGPEPQRTVLEKLLLDQLVVLVQYKILFIRGVDFEISKKITSPHIEIKNRLLTHEMEEALNTSHLLISRPGYSSLMDIHDLNINAIFIPTPGQTEQEYLAKIWELNSRYKQLNQNKISTLAEIIQKQFDTFIY